MKDNVQPLFVQRAPRPRSVTWLAYGVLIFTVLQWVRLFEAVRQWNLLLELQRVSPLYQAVTGGLWGLSGAAVCLGLWRGSRWAPNLTRWLFVFFALYYWFDRVLLVARISSFTIWPFALGMTFLLSGWIFWVLSRPAAKVFFKSSF